MAYVRFAAGYYISKMEICRPCNDMFLFACDHRAVMSLDRLR